ncbi:MAG: hypothetical protein ABW250_15475 [Pyrinomonadaceae bacterium]
MEAIRVLISQRGVHTIKEEWEEENGESSVVDDSRLEVWSRGAVLWPEGWLKGEPSPMEVLLCFDSELLRLGYDESFVRRVVARSHQSMWGAKVYIVVDNDARLPFHALGARQDGNGFHSWVEELLRSGVSDVLQWPPRKEESLSAAAALSEERMRGLVTDVTVREWKCYVRTPPDLGVERASFLAPYLVRSTRELGEANCVLVLQGPPEDAAELAKVKKLIRRLLEQRPGRRLIVGLIDESTKPPAALEAFCAETRGCYLVWFHGVVELYYFLRKLSLLNREEPTPVPVIENATFRSHAPRLLVTHSYQPGDKHGCLAAAQDVWELIRDLRGKFKVTVYPAVKCVNLPRVLDGLGDVLIWVHIGHGDDARGLQQADDPVFKSADDWLSGFAEYGSSLALAVFTSCYSAPVARRFAESGVGVSVGFTREVHKRVCREVTTRVVKAALMSNGSRESILKAFEAGRRLLSIEDKKAMPVAFWASH